MPAKDGRQLCILYLSAIGDGMRWLLPMAEEFSRDYQLISYVSYEAHRITEHKPVPPDQIEACDVLLCHHPDALTFAPGYREAYDSFLAGFPAGCRKITFGNPLFRALWPFRADDPRNADPNRPVNRHGELPNYPFGDSFVLERLQAAEAPEDVINSYLDLDVSSVVDLSKLLHETLAYLEANEQGCDIRSADFVADDFKETKPFSTDSLPSNALYLYVTNLTLNLLKINPLPLTLLGKLQLLVKMEIPIHPSIGRFFDAAYITQTTRYRIDRQRYLTFAEYIHDYVYFV